MNNVSKFPVKGPPKPVCPRCGQPPDGTMVCIKGAEGELHLHERCWFQTRLEAETQRADAATRILASTLARFGNAVLLSKDDFAVAEKVGFKFTATDLPGDLLELRLDGTLIVPPTFGPKS